MNKELLEQALEAALSLLEYEHEEYTETRRKWGDGNPHRWERLKECTEKTNALVNSLRDAIARDRTQRQAEPLPDPQTLKQAHEAWRLTLPRQSAMDSESAAFVAGFKAQRPVEPYDQTALELCSVCGWKTLIPGEGCLNCERDQRQAGKEPARPDDEGHHGFAHAGPFQGVTDQIIGMIRAQRQAGQEPYGYEYDKLCDDSMGRGWEKCFARTVPSYETVQNVKALFTAPPAPQSAQLPEGWIEIRLPQDGQAIEGKSAIDAPVWIEDYDTREQLANMRFWRPAPDRPR